jgi:hypothetical protein
MRANGLALDSDARPMMTEAGARHVPPRVRSGRSRNFKVRAPGSGVFWIRDGPERAGSWS